MKISIIIPTYNAFGRGREFVRYCIGQILNQSHSDYEVIVSDQSLDDGIKHLVGSYCDKRFTWIRNTQNIGSSSSNLNFGIAHATGEIIKPMFHDDYFFSNDALAIINNDFLGNPAWVIVGSNQTKDRQNYYGALTPYWNDSIVIGRNTLGSPSCVAYKNTCDIKWDEGKLWLIDCKFYWEMFNKYGLPYLENTILVSNLSHSGQLSHTLPNERKRQEVEDIKKEFNIKPPPPPPAPPPRGNTIAYKKIRKTRPLGRRGGKKRIHR